MTTNADREEQSDELLALSGILDPTAFSHSVSQCGENKGVIEVEVRLAGDGVIEILRGEGKPNFTVKYLPPVKLEFSLPDNYPSLACPLYCISSPWLVEQQRKKLEEQLKYLWDEQGGGVILFTWLNFLQEELLEFLGIEENIDISAFSERLLSKDEESPTICDNHDNLKLVDDDVESNQDNGTVVKQDSASAEKDASSTVIIKNLQENKISKAIIDAVEEAQPVYKVVRWNVSKQYGVIDTDRGEALVRHSNIVGHNITKLEASLEVGEMVECKIVNRKNKIERFTWELEAFDVLGVDGRMVTGSSKVENIKVLEENVVGSVLRWNKREKEGMLRGPKGDVYVYYTCVQEDVALSKGDMVVFHVVDSQRWGVLASYVRRLKGDSIRNEEEKEWGRIKAERGNRNIMKTSPETSGVVLTGCIKKWDDVAGKGVIMSDQGKELSFSSEDCIARREEGFRLFNRGDRVTFVELFAGAAGKIEVAPELDSGVSSTDSSVDLQGGERMGDSEEVKEETDKHCVTTDNGGKEQAAASSVTLIKNLSDSVAVRPKRTRRKSGKEDQLATLLREFNNMREEGEFAVSLNSCQICFSDKIGSQCLRFVGCNHVYCRDCMTNYFMEKISTGAVSSLVCPTFKCETQALPNQVAELVPHEMFQKYESLLLETQLESMTDVMLCPRVVCQCPTLIDRETNMGQCPGCRFAFCIYCKATYHGVSPCKFKSSEQRAILERYKNSSGEERVFLEKRYGKKQLATMSATLASEDYMASHARQCPHCNAPIEKNEGCNKITCWRCNTHFCWLCGDRLPQVNPYTHFNVQGGKCFGALFQGVDPMEADDEFVDFFDDEDDWQEVQAALLGV